MLRLQEMLALSVPAILLLVGGPSGWIGRMVTPVASGSGRAPQAARGRPDQSGRLPLAACQSGARSRTSRLQVTVPRGCSR